MTRRYPLAQLLLREALLKAHEIYGKDHLKYADCLQDYAFYLLNVDKVGLSVQAYEEALKVRKKIIWIPNNSMLLFWMSDGAAQHHSGRYRVVPRHNPS